MNMVMYNTILNILEIVKDRAVTIAFTLEVVYMSFGLAYLPLILAHSKGQDNIFQLQLSWKLQEIKHY